MSCPPYPPTVTLPAQPGWFSRNWKWVLPAGCLGLVLLVVLFVAAVGALVFGMIKSSEPYQTAVQRAASSAEVARQLGSPVSPRWWVSGNINLNGSGGTADLTIPLVGSRAKAKVYVIGQKTAGQWTYSRMEVEIEGTEVRTSLLPPAQ